MFQEGRGFTNPWHGQFPARRHFSQRSSQNNAQYRQHRWHSLRLPGPGPDAKPDDRGVNQLRLRLYKVPGSPATTYKLNNMLVYSGSNGSPHNFVGTDFTLTATGEGSFSGRFAGKVSAASSAIPGPYTTLTNGVFTTIQF